MSHGEVEPLVNQFQHEAHRKRASEALQALRKIASIVKPIMRQRNWMVGTLCEFYPPESNLLGLNINRGEKICLRLRYPGDENQFLPLEQVVDTMLHELCHIVHGPHDQAFHALWDQLRDEHQALLNKGYTGEGFLGRGERLGGQRIPMHEARRRARMAAEKRKTLSAGSGQRLGGRPIMRGEDVRSVIVNAIEQRNRINQGCASGTDKGREIARDVGTQKPGVTVTKAEDDDANEAAIMQSYIEMIQQEEREKHGENYIPPSQSNPAGMRSTTGPPLLSNSLRAQQASIEESLKRNQTPPVPSLETKPTMPGDRTATQNVNIVPPSPPVAPETWTCDVCTLVNPINYLQCDACGLDRPMRFSDASPPPVRRRPSPSTSANNLNLHSKTPNALKPRMSAADALAKFDAEDAYKQQRKPMAWRCAGCGTYVEQEWWTCTLCGRMKENS